MDKNNTQEAVDSLATRLCLSCGLCCQGIFFYHDEDPVRYGNEFKHLVKRGRNIAFPLACRLLDDTRCLVHEDPKRMSCCKDSQCQLLKRVLQNQTTVEDGQKVVSNIKALLLKITTQCHDVDRSKPLNQALTDILGEIKLELAAGNRSKIELFMDITSMKRLLNHYILPVEGV